MSTSTQPPSCSSPEAAPPSSHHTLAPVALFHIPWASQHLTSPGQQRPPTHPDCCTINPENTQQFVHLFYSCCTSGSVPVLDFSERCCCTHSLARPLAHTRKHLCQATTQGCSGRVVGHRSFQSHHTHLHSPTGVKRSLWCLGVCIPSVLARPGMCCGILSELDLMFPELLHTVWPAMTLFS